MKIRLSSRDIELICFLGRYKQIKAVDCKKIYQSKDYHRKRLKVLEKEGYIKREIDILTLQENIKKIDEILIRKTKIIRIDKCLEKIKNTNMLCF